jgi:hypothetical protein
MDEKRKKRLEALRKLARKPAGSKMHVSDDKGYFQELREKKKKRVERAVAGQDHKKQIDDKMELDEKIYAEQNKDKSQEDLEHEAERRLKKERIKKGYLK